MRKTISLILTFIILLSLFTIPVSAEETINDLTKVHTLLDQNLYTAYYKDSKYYDDYQRVMDEIAELLESDDYTQEEISRYYKEIRDVYSKLLRDCHDYSSLENLLKAYDALDSSIFTEDSWKLLLSVRDKVNKELTSPQIYYKEVSWSDETYEKCYEVLIKSFTTSFQNAFQQLEFKPVPEEMTPEYLMGYVKLVRFCAREELLGASADWKKLVELMHQAEEEALNYNKDEIQDEDVKKDEKDEVDEEISDVNPLQKYFDDLTEIYFKVCRSSYNYSASTEALTKFEILNSKSFSEYSWERYAQQAKKLEQLLTKNNFFFIPYDANEAVCKEYAENYLNSLPSALLDAQNKLIPVETENELRTLCTSLENKTKMNGLDTEHKNLIDAVKKGKHVLENPDATRVDVEEAIRAIETAYDNLDLAEKHLTQAQNSVVKQDASATRFTIIFYIGSILAAAGLAIFLSKLYYGKVNWSK